MRDVNSVAPAFSLSSQDYGMVILNRVIEENDYVVVFFFLAAGSPGCTTEVTGFKQQIEEFRRRRIAVVGISGDTVGALTDFARQIQPGFELCSDTDHRIAEEWGTWADGRQMRSTFVVNSKGTITHVFPRVSVHSHPAELLALLATEQGEPSAASPATDEAAAPAATGSAPAAGAESAGSESVQAPRVVAQAAPGLSAGEVVAGFARTSLQLLLAHAEAGGTVPADVVQLAARLAQR